MMWLRARPSAIQPFLNQGGGLMASPDTKALLLRQIRALRQRIDPTVLAQAERAAQANRPTERRAQPEESLIPYDKEAARAAIAAFLQARGDGGRFAIRLMEEMRKPDAAAKAYGEPPPPPRHGRKA
jgi:hypothetical protein